MSLAQATQVKTLERGSYSLHSDINKHDMSLYVSGLQNGAGPLGRIREIVLWIKRR